MVSGNLLEIYYDRVTSTSIIILNETNCYDYGFLPTKKIIDGIEYTLFYKQGDSEENYLQPTSYEGNVAITEYTVNSYKRLTHIAPSCSQFKVSFADVDREGSGRNSLTGEMYRERIGKYIKIDLTWDLIPNTIEYNNWYKVLTHLPPFFNAKILLPSGKIEDKKFYRSDVTTNLYLFVSDRQIWQGLATSFIQANVDEYNDVFEPTLETPTDDGLISNPIFENGDNLYYGD